MRIKIDVDDNRLRAAFKKAPRRAKNALQKAINVGSIEFQKIMIQESPIDTGRLSQNIFVQTGPHKAIISPDYNRTPYARWVTQKGVSPRKDNLFVERTLKRDEVPLKKATQRLSRELANILD